MKLPSFWVFILFMGLASASHGPASELSNRPRVGLVLSGGGAKGFAHIGIIKILDSLQIPVDYIAGTSMGGIAGALYSIGYNGRDLEKLAQRKDWEEIFTDQPPRALLPYFQKKDTGKYQLEFGLKGIVPKTPSGLIFGQKVSLLFTSLTFPYERIVDFDQMPIPFRCVAVDLVTGSEVILKGGSLAKAMRATMAIPTVFSPVEWGDSLLVDGGLMNNLPVDVVKAMGADIVIAVDVENPLKDREELNTALAVLDQTVTLLGIERKRKNLSLADVVIHPDIRGFTPADFDNESIREIIRRGDQAARASVPALVTLKETHGLVALQESAYHLPTTTPVQIQSVQVTGHTTVPFQLIYDQLNLKENDQFQPDVLKNQIAELKANGFFRNIRYEVIPVSEQQVRLLIRVQEKQQPVINRIQIVNNQNLPFAFIYRLLGLKPGDRLNTDVLNRRIMEIYGLGYFESIRYDIEPVEENMVNLELIVKEFPIRKLRVGIRYDDLHKLVAVVSAQATNLPISGLRLETEFQFAGLRLFKGKAFYPSRALNLPVYPFLDVEYRDVPTMIFDGLGNKIANYNDRSAIWGFGLGLLTAKSVNAEIGYHYQTLDIKPNIALPDPTQFPSWQDELRKIDARLNIDLLDNVLLPRSGFAIAGHYEGSFKKLKSDLSFYQMNLSADFYKTIASYHTLRFYTFWGLTAKNTPIYKYFNQGRPDYFVGVKYDQLFASKMSILRLDYRYQLKKDLFFSLMANTAFNLEYVREEEEFNYLNIWGAGIGLKYMSPIGPIECILSRGDKNFYQSRAWQTVIYVTMGTKF